MHTAVTMRSTKRSSACKHERIQINKHLYIIVWCAFFPSHAVFTADNMCGWMAADRTFITRETKRHAWGKIIFMTPKVDSWRGKSFMTAKKWFHDTEIFSWRQILIHDAEKIVSWRRNNFMTPDFNSWRRENDFMTPINFHDADFELMTEPKSFHDAEIDFTTPKLFHDAERHFMTPKKSFHDAENDFMTPRRSTFRMPIPRPFWGT